MPGEEVVMFEEPAFTREALTDHDIPPGSYKRTLALYAFVPLTSLLFFIFLALSPTWFWPIRWPSPPTFPRSLPSPLPDFILATAFWSLAHLLRTPLWLISSRIFPRVFDTIVFNASYVLISTLLRIAALAALRVRHEMTYPRPTWRDEAFRAVWWLGLGWGFAEAAVSITQGYQQLACYRTVMVPVDRVKEILAQSRSHAQWGIGSGSINTSREYMPLSPRGAESPAADGLANSNSNGLGSANGGPTESGSRRPSDANPMSLEEAVRLAVDHDVEQLLHLQEREELEEVYGVPVIVSVLLLTLGICTRSRSWMPWPPIVRGSRWLRAAACPRVLRAVLVGRYATRAASAHSSSVIARLSVARRCGRSGFFFIFFCVLGPGVTVGQRGIPVCLLCVIINDINPALCSILT